MSREQHAFYTLLAVLVLTAIKGYVFLLTQSLSVLTEFFDSILDIISSLGAFYAIREGLRPPDVDHHYGHGKFESLVAYTIAVFAAIAGFYIIVEVIQRMLYGFSINVGLLSLLLVSSTVVIDVLLASYNYIGFKKHDSLALKANFVNYLGDAARGIGVLVALFSATIGLYFLDAIIAVVLVGILYKESFELFRESSRILLDEAPIEIVERAKIAATRVKGVKNVKKIRARCMGNMPFIDITITVSRDRSVEEAHMIADNVEREIKNEIKNADVVVHVEPEH